MLPCLFSWGQLILPVAFIEMDVEPETFYGRKVVSFKDINGFDISFSSALTKQ